MEDLRGMAALWWPQRNCRSVQGVLLSPGKNPTSVGPTPVAVPATPTPPNKIFHLCCWNLGQTCQSISGHFPSLPSADGPSRGPGPFPERQTPGLPRVEVRISFSEVTEHPWTWLPGLPLAYLRSNACCAQRPARTGSPLGHPRPLL